MSGLSATYRYAVPFAIQGETMQRVPKSVEIPIKGRTCRCSSLDHTLISRRIFCSSCQKRPTMGEHPVAHLSSFVVYSPMPQSLCCYPLSSIIAIEDICAAAVLDDTVGVLRQLAVFQIDRVFDGKCGDLFLFLSETHGGLADDGSHVAAW